MGYFYPILGVNLSLPVFAASEVSFPDWLLLLTLDVSLVYLSQLVSNVWNP